jgi:GDPmannose 4,6-dehydratase
VSKVALITGARGQDGSYLSEHLLSLGYEVHGLIRVPRLKNQNTYSYNLDSRVNTHRGNILNATALHKIVSMVAPDEIYNLAAVHKEQHRDHDSGIPSLHNIMQINTVGVLNLLEAYRTSAPHAKFFQAGSSEMFGRSSDNGVQKLTTSMNPISSYGCTKLLAHNLVCHYRDAYKLHASNGILFNHESPRRNSVFVTGKIVKAAVEIKRGTCDKLELGNIDSQRDWGHAKDYVHAMHLITNHNEPRDWIISTGKTNSVKDICEYVFHKLGMDYKEHVVKHEKYMRPDEISFLRGCSFDTKNILGWTPNYTFESMLDEMIYHWEQEA